MPQPEPQDPKPSPKPDPRWYREGLCFSCTACGNCCRSNGEYAHVYVTPPEIKGLAAHLGLSEPAFRSQYCGEADGWTTLIMPGDNCVFLDAQGLCQVYDARPSQCRTWPFWEENLKPGVWQGPMKEICPGLDTGPRHTADEIDHTARTNEEWYESNGGLG